MTFRKIAAALAIVLATGAAAYAQATQPARPATTTAPAAQAALINVNTANADELDKLPQIGPARAKAIIDNRVAAKGGAYKDIADLEKRADLPSNAIAAIKDKIRFR